MEAWLLSWLEWLSPRSAEELEARDRMRGMVLGGLEEEGWVDLWLAWKVGPVPGLPDPKWRELGFQQDDPRSDIRFAPKATLWLLAKLVLHRRAIFARHQSRTEDSYPVAVLCMHILRRQLIRFGFVDTYGRAITNQETGPVYSEQALLWSSLEDLDRFDRLWTGHTYMDFGRVWSEFENES